MAYVNEIIPEEEKRTYMIPGYKEITPSILTIDREKNIKLFKYWTNIDEPHEVSFAFVYQENVVKMVLIKHVKENTVTWNLKSIRIPDELLSQKQEVMDELRKALKTYGLFGYQLGKPRNTETVVNF